MILPPGRHDKCIIDRNASDLLYTFCLQVVNVLHKAGEVCLNEVGHISDLLSRQVVRKAQQRLNINL